MKIPFTKLNGNGNDFILIDEYDDVIIPDPMKGEFAGSFCDRHFGIGADGVLYLSKAQSTGDLAMRLFQPDQSEAEMCGNGIRCFVKYAFDHHHVGEKCIIETKAGLIPVTIRYIDDDFMADVLMTDPAFDRSVIPATGTGEYKEIIAGYEVFAVNTGVPHAVIFVDSVESVALETVAPGIRYHPTFPMGANVDFVEKNGEDSIRIRTYERGVEAETLSCGTGATASAAVAHKAGLVGETVHVDTEGGPLIIRLGKETHLEGPASTVFTGEITF
ncbi:MAG TPA: diaminopimelate epimerase [Methanoregulaceae archaeon]|nr:diaminopimelate epimerase [Methanoregulaceae archaeon]